MITVTVQLLSTRMIVRKSVDNTHGIACSLCDSWLYCNYACTKLWRLRNKTWPLLMYSSGWLGGCVRVIRTTVGQHFNWYRASRGSVGDSWLTCSVEMLQNPAEMWKMCRLRILSVLCSSLWATAPQVSWVWLGIRECVCVWSRCTCENAARCDHVTGDCHCSPGWTGDDCSQACRPGYWGRECRQVNIVHSSQFFHCGSVSCFDNYYCTPSVTFSVCIVPKLDNSFLWLRHYCTVEQLLEISDSKMF